MKAWRRLSLRRSLSAGSSQDGTTTVRPPVSARAYGESGGSSYTASSGSASAGYWLSAEAIARRRTSKGASGGDGSTFRPATSSSSPNTALMSATLGTIASTSSRAVCRRSSVVPIEAVASTSRDSRSWARAARASAWNRSVMSMTVAHTPSTRPPRSLSRK